MDAAAELALEHVVDEPVLGDPAHALELRGDDDGLEVVPVVARDLRGRAGDGRLDSLLQLFARRHIVQG